MIPSATNAGESSLMRALTQDEVYVADQLFATLDTTVRVLTPETRPRILVSDTVASSRSCRMTWWPRSAPRWKRRARRAWCCTWWTGRIRPSAINCGSRARC
jgi:hypothetical protein